MIAQYDYLHRHPAVFRALTGVALDEFALLLGRFAPAYTAAEPARPARPAR